jgi:hypothetical protein
MSALFTPTNVRIAMGLAFFPVGLFAILSGLIILMSGPYRTEAKILAQQSARLSQKGLTDNISLVAQSATSLVESVNGLIKTSSGNAIVLVIVGFLLEAACYWLMAMPK